MYFYDSVLANDQFVMTGTGPYVERVPKNPKLGLPKTFIFWYSLVKGPIFCGKGEARDLNEKLAGICLEKVSERIFLSTKKKTSFVDAEGALKGPHLPCKSLGSERRSTLAWVITFFCYLGRHENGPWMDILGYLISCCALAFLNSFPDILFLYL